MNEKTVTLTTVGTGVSLPHLFFLGTGCYEVGTVSQCCWSEIDGKRDLEW